MSATLYGIDTGATMTLDLSNYSQDISLTDITETVVGGNILIGLTNSQFSDLLDISTNGGTGTAEFNEINLRSLLANCIDATGSGTLYETVASSDITSGSIGTFPDSGNTSFYNFSDMIQFISTNHLSVEAGLIDDLKYEFAAKAAGVSLNDFRETYDASTNLLNAMTNAGVLSAFDNIQVSQIKFLGNGLNAVSLSGDDDYFSFNAATAQEKQDLFNSLVDAGYIDTGDGIGTGVDVSFDNEFALGLPLTLKGGVDINIQMGADISFVDASSGDVVDTADATNLVGTLANTTVSHTSRITDSIITSSIPSCTIVTDNGDVTTDAIKFNLMFVKVPE